MEALFALVNSGPATVFVVAIVLVILHRAGVLEVVLSFIAKKEPREGKQKDAPQDFRGLALKMDKLASYYNHDTTALLTEIRDDLRKLRMTHDNYEIVGIKTRDCAKRP